MRIITLNANGIRSAERKGFFIWMQQQNADIICIQETKAQIHQLNPDPFCPKDYYVFIMMPRKKAIAGLLCIAENSRTELLSA
jgi:exodeoxyribonuclease-3